jgi:glycerol-3-phosphate dehydrogenase (NAD(P)+)
MKKVAVLGAGSWGTALSIVLADNGHQVNLWTYKESQALEINKKRINNKYLPDIFLSEQIKAFYDMNQAIQDVSAIVIVVPTKAIREVSKELKKYLNHKVLLVHATKGIEPDSLKTVSQLIEEELPKHLYGEVVVLSGPSHAEEVATRKPTTVTVSCKNMMYAEAAQALFINNNFRVYTNADIVGVEIGGALKNIIALGAGISDGLNYGDNAKAALITRGLAEITRLGIALGADPLTFIGLAGVGDLIVTCTSVHSRNWRAGNMIGKGYKLDEVLDTMGMVVEGVKTTNAAYRLSVKMGIEMPITHGIYQVLFNQQHPKDIVDQLMSRDRKEEILRSKKP